MNGAEMGRKAGYSPLDREEIAHSHTIRVTNSAWDNLETLGAKYGMSRSAFIDAIGRGVLVLGDSDDPIVSSSTAPSPPIPIATTPPPTPPQST
jgi:hypothetical protein